MNDWYDVNWELFSFDFLHVTIDFTAASELLVARVRQHGRSARGARRFWREQRLGRPCRDRLVSGYEPIR